MIRSNPNGDYPDIDKTSYIDPSAVIIGKVDIGRNVFVGPGAVIRADEEKSFIIISDNCNIQDRVIIHALGNSKVVIGENTSLSHGCIIHGPCKIGKGCFIGFGSVVFRSELKDRVFVKFMAGVLDVNISAGRMIPNGIIVDTNGKARGLKPVSKEWMKFSRCVLKANLDLLRGYKR
jgi:carbonic anhydrase/acetyltransferase-like protein (isoleucine patch superfamily)